MIELAHRDDFREVRRLLEECSLPLAGADEHMPCMVAREDGKVIGSAGLELYADGALLRSVAVDPHYRGAHVGHQLIEAALQLARASGVDAVFLLTTTAAQFFPKFGFVPIGPGDVPASVQASVEFQSACPASAVVMRKYLP